YYVRAAFKPHTQISYFYFFLRPRTISLSDDFLPRRVFLPSVGLPQGDIGEGIPIGARPSPPPCGGSLGFITEPRTVGRIPFHLERPALRSLTSSCWILPTCPIVARQVERIIRTSPDLNLINTYLPSLPNTCALAPAERAICPPLPGFNSML